jgi:hypothetical protein
MCIPPIITRQRLYERVPAAKNTCNNKRIVGCVVFYAVLVLPNKNLWVCLCISLSLLGNNSVKSFPRQRKIVGGVVFYVVHIASKESRRLVLPRTPCYLLQPSVFPVSFLRPFCVLVARRPYKVVVTRGAGIVSRLSRQLLNRDHTGFHICSFLRNFVRRWRCIHRVYNAYLPLFCR